MPLGLREKLWSQNETLPTLFGGYLIFISKYLLLGNNITIRFENTSTFLFETNFIIQICIVEFFGPFPPLFGILWDTSQTSCKDLPV